MKSTGIGWEIQSEHLVSVPITRTLSDASSLLRSPDWTQINNPAVYLAGLTIALVASLETLLNLQAVDNLDPQQRHSPPNRELLAQGVGNVAAGLLGGLPITSVIVRSSVNIHAGGQTKLSTIFHGILLASTVLLIPDLLNSIPLSCLAAILLHTGFKLANPKLFQQMKSEGPSQLIPFTVTVLAIVLTDLLVGILIGLGTALCFILYNNFRRPLRRVIEGHAAGDVVRLELANQVSFFSRGALQTALQRVPDGSQVLIDARQTNFIDRDVLDLIDDYRLKTAPAHDISLSLLGLEQHHAPLKDEIRYVHHAVPALQSSLTPMEVVQVLRNGNERFRNGDKLTRDVRQQVLATANHQSPLAVIFSCVDSRAPAELVFDASIGDVFNVRIAGNVLNDTVLGSMEYGCAVAKAKLVVVLGHTGCGAVTKAVDLLDRAGDIEEAVGSKYIASLVDAIQRGIHPSTPMPPKGSPGKSEVVDHLARENVIQVMQEIYEKSAILRPMINEGSVGMVGGMYDVRTGTVDFFDIEGNALALHQAQTA